MPLENLVYRIYFSGGEGGGHGEVGPLSHSENTLIDLQSITSKNSPCGLRILRSSPEVERISLRVSFENDLIK